MAEGKGVFVNDAEGTAVAQVVRTNQANEGKVVETCSECVTLAVVIYYFLKLICLLQ